MADSFDNERREGTRGPTRSSRLSLRIPWSASCCSACIMLASIFFNEAPSSLRSVFFSFSCKERSWG